MAGKIAINRVTNGNVYVNGTSLLGRVKSVDLPEVASVLAEHQALGMVGKVNLPSGFEALNGKISWTSIYEEVAKQVCNPFKAVQLQVRSSIERYGPQGRQEQTPLVTYLTVQFTKNAPGSFAQHQPVEPSSEFTATYIKQVINGVEALELDYMANIFRVNGEDVLETYRANLGE